MRTILALAAGIAMSGLLQADEFYVSAGKGKGKQGTKEAPVREIGILSDKLKDGDTVYVAGGTYVGLGDSGSDEIKAAVKIIGGYDESFARRNPWGDTKSVFTGINKSDNFKSTARLTVGNRRGKGSEITVDGIIFDNGPRNGYVGEDALKIARKYNPKTKTNIAPDSPGLSIDAPAGCNVTVANCVVMNTAPTHKTGALKVFGGTGTRIAIRNNLIVNNTGSGICCLSWSHAKDAKDMPAFTVENNTVLFTWKYDEMSTDSGSALKMESNIALAAKGNVFAFSDAFGIDNAARSRLSATGNLFCASLIAPYREFSTKFKLERVEEEAKSADVFTGNVKEQITVPVPAEWAKNYASRAVIDRAAAEASVEPLDNWQNDMRRMLNLPLDGGKIDVASAIWLHRLSTEDGLKAGEKPYLGKFGCAKPPAQ